MKKYNFLIIFLFFTQLSIAQLKVGDKIPNIIIRDYIKNEPPDKKLEGKYILLEFWATWCEQCLKELPKINSLAEKYSNRDDVIFISITDESPKKARTVFKKHNFSSIVVCDDTSEIHKIFIWNDAEGSYSIPKTILIDPKGIIKWKGSTMKLNPELFAKFLSQENITTADETPFDIPSPTFTK